MGMIYLVRHGETDYHVQGRALGRIDAELNDLGNVQASLVAEGLLDKNITAIYSSPLLRCRQTAAPLSLAIDKPVEVVEGLQEIDLGDWDGLPFPEIYKMGGETFAKWMTEPAEVRIPGGEMLGEVRERVIGAALDILKRHTIRDGIAIFTHGGPLRLLLCAVMGLDINRIFRVEVDLCSISGIKFFSDTIEENTAITRINDTCHLGEHKSRTRG
jgi:broad specificity phosphatase PhoE